MDISSSRKQLGIAELIIIAPVFHFTCASLFLIGYCFYIGRRLSSFVSPIDLFSVSIGDIGPLYFLTLGFPVVYILSLRASKGAWTHSEAAGNAPEGPLRDAAMAKLKSDRKFYRALCVFVLVMQPLYMAAVYFRWGYIPMVMVQTIVIMAFAVGNVWISNKLNIESLRFHATYLVGAMLITAVFSGFSRAQGDMRLQYYDALATGPSCGEFAILRSVSDKFLAVRKDGSHVLINQECKIIFRLNRRVARAPADAGRAK